MKVLKKGNVLVDEEGSKTTLPVDVVKEKGTSIPAPVGKVLLEEQKRKWKTVYSLSADRPV